MQQKTTELDPRMTLAIVCTAIVLVPVTATGASIALNDIGASLHTSLASAQWVVNAFFLTFASFMAITGSLADMFGRRRMFTGGLALFCATMLVAALAPSVWVLVGARALAGVGAAASVTGASALLAHSFEGRARTRAFGVFGTAIGFGLAFGPLVAGVVVTSLGGWRVFFAGAALVLLPVLGIAFRLRESRDPHSAGPDWPGAGTFTLGLSLLIFGMIEGPNTGWTNPLVIGALVGFVALLIVFVRIERRAAHPMIDISLFAVPRFVAICLMPVLLAFGFVAPLISLPAYFMAVDGRSALSAGLLLVLLTGPTLVMPPLVSSIARPAIERVLLTGSLAFVALGAAWLTIIHPGSAIISLAGPLICIGIGFGISLAILDGAAVSSVDRERAGMAAGVFNTMRLGGEAIAIAALGALLTAVTQAQLTGSVGASRAGRVSSAMLQGKMPAGASPNAADAYTDALHTGLWTIAALSVLGLVAVALLTRDRTRDTVAAGACREPSLAHSGS